MGLPATLAKEVRRWATELAIQNYHGPGRRLPAARGTGTRATFDSLSWRANATTAANTCQPCTGMVNNSILLVLPNMWGNCSTGNEKVEEAIDIILKKKYKYIAYLIYLLGLYDLEKDIFLFGRITMVSHNIYFTFVHGVFSNNFDRFL
jgi:hypothetical protein